MTMIEQRLQAVKSAPFYHGCCGETKEDDEDEPPVSRQIEAETNRAAIETKQELDSARQQAFGINQYVWVGGDCPLCAPNDGELFSWGEGDEPGSIHPNCACSAEPALEDAGDADPPKITGEKIAEAALLLASLTPQGIARRIGITAVTRLGAVGRRIIERARANEEPAVAPPSAKPRMDDTKTWPRPPKDGKLKEGTPSRTKPRNRGEKSLYDENGGEWRYDPGDKYHNPHWNYKPPGKAQEWQNITIGDLPHLK